MNERTTPGVNDTYHAVLKLLAAARGMTSVDLLEELLFDGLRHEIERDREMGNVVRELVLRDEMIDPVMQKQTLELLDRLVKAGREGGLV